MDNLLSEASYLLNKDDKWYTTLSNASALLNLHIKNINWVGFYILDNNYLYLGPFMGKPACTKIKVGSGVCGTCIKENKTIIVPNVHEFKGHIACDSESNSEICIPIHINNEIFGLLDIDSKEFNRFDNKDKLLLEEFIKILENKFDKE